MVHKFHFLVLKLKRNFFAILFLCFAFSILLFSKNNLPAVKNGLTLWATSVVPALFPFFVATELLMHTNIVNFLGKILNPFIKPIFNIDGKGGFCFIMGLISGYPVGAKIACEFRKNDICSKIECERLLSFTNNSGPLFIVGTVGISMFGNTTIGILLLITHILACITVGIIFRFWKHQPKYSRNTYDGINLSKNKNFVSVSNLGAVLGESISNSIHTIFIIGGFVVIFSSIISILNSSGIIYNLCKILTPLFNFFHINTSLINPIITGFLEITNGINIISSLHIKDISTSIIITAFFLGFGGISVLLQVWSIIAKSDLSIKPYIYGKLLHGIIAGIYTFIAINIFPFLNLNL